MSLLSTVWILKYANTLNESGLYVKLFERYKDEFGEVSSDLSKAKQVFEASYDLDLGREDEVGWRNTKRYKNFMATDQFAETCFMLLVDHIQSAIEQDE